MDWKMIQKSLRRSKSCEVYLAQFFSHGHGKGRSCRCEICQGVIDKWLKYIRCIQILTAKQEGRSWKQSWS